ncbi:MAG: cobalamin-binding protein [Coleofasciculaceae cyanobacterium]
MKSNLKIVSLLPSATEIVAALGLSSAIIGRSHECDYPPEILDKPICTEAQLNSEQSSIQIDADVLNLVQKALSIYKIKIDVLEQLKPTHIVTQDQCDVCAVNFADVKTAVTQLTQSQPQIISLQPNKLNEVWSDIQRVADSLAVESETILHQLQSRVKACQEKTQNLPTNSRPTVAAIEWTEPLMAAGNWIPELVELAGGQSLWGTIGEHSPYLKWDDLVTTDPEIIIIMPCGFGLERTRQETQAMANNPKWQTLKAVKNGKVYLTDGNSYFNRPGPRLVDSLEILVEILHPKLFNFGYQGTGWERYYS